MSQHHTKPTAIEEDTLLSGSRCQERTEGEDTGTERDGAMITTTRDSALAEFLDRKRCADEELGAEMVREIRGVGEMRDGLADELGKTQAQLERTEDELSALKDMHTVVEEAAWGMERDLDAMKETVKAATEEQEKAERAAVGAIKSEGRLRKIARARVMRIAADLKTIGNLRGQITKLKNKLAATEKDLASRVEDA